jgi:hypothetical protein
MNAISPALAALLEGLTPQELIELEQTIAYLTEQGQRGSINEGSFGAVIGKQSPNVQRVLSQLSRLVETPRIAPFQPKLSEDDYFHTLGLNAEQGKAIKGQLDGEEVLAGLQNRMGTDASLPAEPVTRRDQIEAALALHSNGRK